TIAPIRWEPVASAPPQTRPQPQPRTQPQPQAQPRTQPQSQTQAEPQTQTDVWPRFLSKPDANRIARIMRSVVTSGTARSLRSHPVAIAGKTGTAEVTGAPAHSWFTGFAPYQGDGRRIAFAVIVENAGYGNRGAAPIAGEIVSAAKELGLIK